MKYRVTGNIEGIRDGMLARLDSLFDCELEEALNSDREEFAGSGQFNHGPIRAEAVPQNQLPCSAVICVPPLATVYFRVKKPE